MLRYYFAYTVKFFRDGKEKIRSFDVGKFFQPEKTACIYIYVCVCVCVCVFVCACVCVSARACACMCVLG